MLAFLVSLSVKIQNIFTAIFINPKGRKAAFCLCLDLLFVLIMILMGSVILGRIFPELLQLLECHRRAAQGQQNLSP